MAHVVILGPGARSGIEHPSAELDLALDAQVEATVKFELGTLEFLLPDTVVLPESGHVNLMLRRSADHRKVQTFSARVDPANRARSWSFESALAGEYQLDFELFDPNAEREEITTNGVVTFSKPKPVYRSTSDVVIRPR